MFWNTYSFSVESIHKVLQSSIFVLLLSDDSVLPDDLLLMSGLQKLNSDPSLLLGLPHQTVHQHLLPPCLLLKNYPICSKLDHDHDWERVMQRIKGVVNVQNVALVWTYLLSLMSLHLIHQDFPPPLLSLSSSRLVFLQPLSDLTDIIIIRGRLYQLNGIQQSIFISS